ncbi:MAG: fumarylacetoacetate hydrolase family protein, partial [Spongiibacteraceae bacterium]|nr:fumarylacetoacetate hydrolase family protein [Spongiibacteraceae bacterium]
DSMLERVVEEKAMGDPSKAREIRESLLARMGGDLSSVVPGSEKSRQLKAYLLDQGLWSQYLEVGLGPDAEIFSKAPVMSAVGLGSAVGLHPASKWNNPEPEVVLAVNQRADIVGCTLGNDVNLRDIEGRSALLLGRAKDNNRSCAIGPFIRLLDETFTLDDIRQTSVNLEIDGRDGFSLKASSDLGRISRDIEDLVQQVIGSHHQYPDGFLLFTGTMYAPIDDRHEVGGGFTHELGDIVTIQSPKLGALVNPVGYSNELPAWEFGLGALINNLAQRGYIGR